MASAAVRNSFTRGSIFLSSFSFSFEEEERCCCCCCCFLIAYARKRWPAKAPANKYGNPFWRTLRCSWLGRSLKNALLATCGRDEGFLTALMSAVMRMDNVAGAVVTDHPKTKTRMAVRTAGRSSGGNFVSTAASLLLGLVASDPIQVQGKRRKGKKRSVAIGFFEEESANGKLHPVHYHRRCYCLLAFAFRVKVDWMVLCFQAAPMATSSKSATAFPPHFYLFYTPFC